jgi:DNA polymerase
MSTNGETTDDPRAELAEICRALGAHLDELALSGAWGLPAAAKSIPERASAPAAVDRPSVVARPDPPPQQRAPAPSALASPPAPSAVPERARERLAVVQSEVKACTRCGLHAQRRQTVFSRGTGSSGLMFIGEGPGEEEDIQGLPFVGPAGQLLDRMIAAMKIDRDAVYVCNIVKCRPPKNRKPELDEMQRCMPFLDEQINVLEPKVIVALGATAVQGLLGTSEGITRLRGQWKLYRGRIPVMPTFHPAFLLRQPGSKREVWQDLQDVMRRLEEGASAG